MRNVAFRSGLVSAAVCLALLNACNGGDDSSGAPGAGALAPGDTLGSIERFPGGTAVAQDLRMISSIDCNDGQLRILTDQELLVADMSCDVIENRDFVDRFIGIQSAIVVLDGDRIRLENDFSGSLELPASSPRLGEIDDAP